MTRRSTWTRALGVGLGVLVATLGGPGLLEPDAARAVSVRIVVNTSEDVVGADGYCSLREAIRASNDGFYMECDGSNGSADTIVFDMPSGDRQIDLEYELPVMTEAVTINGGASRVRLRGPGSGIGLVLQGAGASRIRNLNIDNFGTGIMSGGGYATIVGNVIGPNSGTGIYATTGATIGGIDGVTPGGPCTGDCNVISGNAGYGLYLASGGLVKGNFIGVNAAGTAASPNGRGVSVSSGNWTFGGPAAGEGNVISGNTVAGIEANGCACVIQGNFIGTNAAGNAAIPNGGAGVSLQNMFGDTVIGGSVAGSGNVISGNLGHGIDYHTVPSNGQGDVSILGNRIGVKANGGALGNGGNGVFLGRISSSVRGVVIGSATDAGAANVIAYNGGAGVRVRGGSRNAIRGNSIVLNSGAGILIDTGANDNVAAPTITGLGSLLGTACAGCTIDVYSDSADEGRTYHGSTIADGSGNWVFTGVVSGPNATATSTKVDQYGKGSTSAFSAPFTLPVPRQPDGRIRKGTGTLVGNNIYNLTGTNQTRTGSTTRGSTITFNISIQNDAALDRFAVLAAAGNSQYRVKYFRNSTEITSAVVAGTYQTANVAKGDTFVIKAKVTVLSGAAVGSSISRLVTISSVADPTRQDAVKFVVKRS